MLCFISKGAKAAVTGWLFVLFLSIQADAQAKRTVQPRVVKPSAAKAKEAAVKVTLVNEVSIRKILEPKGKPLLVNFWATWCDPCREEFPDLVKFDNEFKGKIDFITISLDDVEEIATSVPKFLASMKAEMPAYLLKTPDESAVITSISKEWQGGMPFTVLYGTDGKLTYFRQGKVVLETLRGEVNKALSRSAQPVAELFVVADFVKIKDGRRDEALFFYENNWKIYREEAKKRGVIESFELVDARSEKNADFDLILITRYRGEDQYKNSEKNFEPILKQLRPNGPALKNALKPEEFRQNVFVYNGRSLFAS